MRFIMISERIKQIVWFFCFQRKLKSLIKSIRTNKFFFNLKIPTLLFLLLNALLHYEVSVYVYCFKAPELLWVCVIVSYLVVSLLELVFNIQWSLYNLNTSKQFEPVFWSLSLTDSIDDTLSDKFMFPPWVQRVRVSETPLHFRIFHVS